MSTLFSENFSGNLPFFLLSSVEKQTVSHCSFQQNLRYFVRTESTLTLPYYVQKQARYTVSQVQKGRHLAATAFL